MTANAKFWIAIAGVLAVLPVSASAGVRAKLPDVRARLEREGPEATGRRLSTANQWDSVLDGMARGEAGWIAIAPLLAKGADGANAEGLGIALAEALPKNAGAVLAALDPSNGPILGASRVCSAPFIEPKPGRIERYKPKALAAVRAVRASGLRPARQACLEALATI